MNLCGIYIKRIEGVIGDFIKIKQVLLLMWFYFCQSPWLFSFDQINRAGASRYHCVSILHLVLKVINTWCSSHFLDGVRTQMLNLEILKSCPVYCIHINRICVFRSCISSLKMENLHYVTDIVGLMSSILLVMGEKCLRKWKNVLQKFAFGFSNWSKGWVISS